MFLLLQIINISIKVSNFLNNHLILLRADKNSDAGQFGSGQIGHLDKNFIPEPCSDYKLDTLTKPGPGPEYPMSGPDCPNVRICDMILGHFN